MDDEFSDVFSEFVRSLPRSIVSKCKKNIVFSEEKRGIKYKLDGYDEEYIEFSAGTRSEHLLSLCLHDIKLSTLKQMDAQDNDDNFRNINDKSIMEIGSFEYKGNDGKVGYSFYICRRKDGYYGVMKKRCDDKSLDRKEKIKIDVSRLLGNDKGQR